jgi:hypothetical protein
MPTPSAHDLYAELLQALVDLREDYRDQMREAVENDRPLAVNHWAGLCQGVADAIERVESLGYDRLTNPEPDPAPPAGCRHWPRLHGPNQNSVFSKAKLEEFLKTLKSHPNPPPQPLTLVSEDRVRPSFFRVVGETR